MAGTSTSRLKSVVSECILSHRTSFRVYYRLILLHLILSHLLTLCKIICMLLLYWLIDQQYLDRWPHFIRLSQPATKMPGQSGGKKSVLLELKLIADVGLVGFPNVSTHLVLKHVPALLSYLSFLFFFPPYLIIYLLTQLLTPSSSPSLPSFSFLLHPSLSSTSSPSLFFPQLPFILLWRLVNPLY